jgi:hypothetical protein
VYVFTRPVSGWASETQRAELTASDGSALYRAAAVSGDGGTVAAIAPYATVGANAFQGAVYVFGTPPCGC